MKKFKSLTVILLALVLVISSGVVAYAKEGKVAVATVTASATEAKAGENITFTCNLSNTDTFTSMCFYFDFDHDKLEYVSSAWLTQGGVITNYDQKTGLAVWASGTAASHDGDAFTITYKVKEGVLNEDIEVKVQPQIKYGQLSYSVTKEVVKTVKVHCDHQYGAWTKLDDNQHSRTCSVCSGVEKADHTWGEGVVTKEATCVAEGEKTYTCTACSATKTEVVLKDENNHKNTEIRDAKDPNGNVPGYTGDTWCKDCNTKIATGKEIPVGDPTTVTMRASATSIKRGDSVTFTVNFADSPEFTSMGLVFAYDKDKFDYVNCEWVVDGGVLKNFDPATGLAAWAAGSAAARNGDVCRLTLKAKDDAEYGDYTVSLTPMIKKSTTSFPVTTVAPITISVVSCDHQYGAWTKVDDNNHSRSCGLCGDVQTEAHGWDDGVVTKAATCKEEGVLTYTCAACGATKTESIQKTKDHVWDNGTVTKEATCVAEGEMTYTCTVCGATKTDVIPVDENNHKNVKVVDAKAASCTEEGYTGDKVCEDCHKTIKKGTVIGKTAHTWNEGTVTKEPTCTEKGEKDVECTVCGATDTIEIDALGHKWDEGKVTKEATETEEGEKLFRCERCDATKTEVIAKIAPTTPGNDNNTNGGTTDTTTTTTDTTKTGDTTDVALYTSIAVISLGALAFVVYKKKKING